MEQNFLKIGDVFELKDGMKIYAPMEARFAYGNKPLSREKVMALCTVGETINVQDGKNQTKIFNNFHHAIANLFDSHLGLQVSIADVGKAVSLLLPDNPALLLSGYYRFKSGQFLVINAKMDGGSELQGYPDGWHITARRLGADGGYDPVGEKISFYQSGSFNCLVDENIPVIKRLEPSFV